MDRQDLSDLDAFLSISQARSFTRAAVKLGVTPSALSHRMRALEERLGVRLLNRTTRSVTLTAAGEELLATIESPIERIGQAIENLNRYRDAPAGRVRINVLEDAMPLIFDPVLPVFIARYPDVEIDISVSNRMIDVIGGGFDAGVRYGGTVPEDMIARRISADVRWIAAAAPDYLARFGRPDHPEALQNHRCIRIRLGNDQIYHWEFEREGEAVSVETPGQITVDNSHASVGLGLRGAGIIFGVEALLRPHLESGALECVLADWAAVGEGYHVYYSSRRHVPTGLRLLIDMIREMRPCGL